MERPLRILAVTRKPDAASYEQRVQRCIPPLTRRGHEITETAIPRGLLAEPRLYRRFRNYDVVWWQRHLAMPHLLPIIRHAARRLVFDYDDPLTFSAKGGGRPSWSRRVRFAGMMRTCDAVTTASDYLAASARPYCSSVHVIPMPVDVPDDPPPLHQRSEKPTLLWLGSRATQPYLDLIRPALESLAGHALLRLVAHEPMAFGELEVDFRPWSFEQQETALRECHVGLCPMPDTPWTRGKCPYKVLQYMAFGMPWVGSAVGENLNVAGVTQPGRGPRGWCAHDNTDWKQAVTELISDPEQAETIGRDARAYIASRYRRDSLIDTLEDVLRGDTNTPASNKVTPAS
ncbi:glycosyltransferase family protein [Mucisphaera calidilacus]|uniref:Uncharacterized protein n=1 Tax=Mucisphaera calidilacus TaxID=2527982 RepID=A0A518BT93_9BACT|nr:glycosyltransferase [Mucisphaera calidilacus]QDU70190.1 hypothetical protein Pan265_00120 [Mucisphaera calidilacus]